ncbi:MAG: type II secretion system F family protein [Opitutaceae bacterium]
MSLFHYKAFSASGESVSGAIEADSLAVLETRLRSAGVWLLEAREHGAAFAATETSFSRLKVKRGEVITFFVQTSLLLRAGITLPQALERMVEDFGGLRMGRVAASLLEKVTIGVPVHQAMAFYPRVFSRQVISMVEAGEISGRMAEVFDSLAKYFEWTDGLMADIRQALIYPMIVTVAALGLIVLLFTMVVPKFVGLLDDLSLEVPAVTRVVMMVSDVLVSAWPVLLSGIAGAVIALRFALRVPRLGCAFDRMLMRMPVFGSLVAMFSLSRFAHNLGMLYAAGITLLKGLEICGSLVGNRAVEAALGVVKSDVLEGVPMSKAMIKHDVFPKTVVTMIATGESSGQLDEALASISDYYNKLIPRRIKMVFAIFNPAVMVILIGTVGTVALAVVLPILQLWQVR